MSAAVGKARQTMKKATDVKKVSSHPPVAEMVTTSIRELGSRRGSSLQSIKKYIAASYKVDAERLKPYIRRYIKNALQKGVLLQAKGTGAAGSFRLNRSMQKTGKSMSKKASKSDKSIAKPKVKKASKTSSGKQAGKVKSVKKVSSKAKTGAKLAKKTKAGVKKLSITKSKTPKSKPKKV